MLLGGQKWGQEGSWLRAAPSKRCPCLSVPEIQSLVAAVFQVPVAAAEQAQTSLERSGEQRWNVRSEWGLSGSGFALHVLPCSCLVSL